MEKRSYKIDNCFHKCSTILIYKIAGLLIHLRTNLVKGSCRKVKLFNDGGLRIASNYRPQRSWGKVIFSEACVHILSTGGGAWLLLGGGGMLGCSGGVWLLPGWGACVVAPLGGMCGCSGGHAWLLPGSCSRGVGGMRGCSWGVCVVALGGGVCVVAPGGCAWLLGGHAWLLRGACVGYDEIRRYGQ